MAKESIVEVAGWRVKSWAAAVDLCEASVYNLLSARKIRAKKVGAATIITTRPDEYLASLPDYEPNARPSPNKTGRNGKGPGRRSAASQIAAAWTETEPQAAAE